MHIFPTPRLFKPKFRNVSFAPDHLCFAPEKLLHRVVTSSNKFFLLTHAVQPQYTRYK